MDESVTMGQPRNHFRQFFGKEVKKKLCTKLKEIHEKRSFFHRIKIP